MNQNKQPLANQTKKLLSLLCGWFILLGAMFLVGKSVLSCTRLRNEVVETVPISEGILVTQKGVSSEGKTDSLSILVDEKDTTTTDRSLSSIGNAKEFSSLSSEMSYSQARKIASFSFLYWNIKDYRVGKKTPDQCDALADEIAHHRPELIGLAEMGGVEAVADLKKRLARHGLDYPYSVVVDKGDAAFCLAFLSQYPLTNRSSFPALVNPEAIENSSKSKDTSVRATVGGMKILDRGILDVEVLFPNQTTLRVMGVHLKSKAGSSSGEEQRVREALLVRAYIHQLWAQGQAEDLLLFGDFNDAPASPALKVIKDNSPQGKAMKMCDLEDDRGESWTHFFKSEESYTRIDYLFLSPSLQKAIARKRVMGVVSNKTSELLSDHRPLYLKVSP